MTALFTSSVRTRCKGVARTCSFTNASDELIARCPNPPVVVWVGSILCVFLCVCVCVCSMCVCMYVRARRVSLRRLDYFVAQVTGFVSRLPVHGKGTRHDRVTQASSLFMSHGSRLHHYTMAAGSTITQWQQAPLLHTTTSVLCKLAT